MSKVDLRKAAEIAPNTKIKMRRDQPVHAAILDRICEVLGCDFGDIVEHTENSGEEDAQSEVLWEQSTKRLEEILQKYADLPNGVHTHTGSYIFPSTAIYLTTKDVIGTEKAYCNGGGTV